MDICIVKSASRDLYLQQNLKLLRCLPGEDVAFRYRNLWVDQQLVDILSSDHHHTATVVYVDPPEYKCIPIRQLEIYSVDVTTESVTFFGRCRYFVDPQDSIDWAHDFKQKHPDAGNPPGKFVLALPNGGGCPVARETYQQTAWRAIIDELVKQPKYSECFFFHNRGLKTEGKEDADPKHLLVGWKYSLNVLSYNKHLANDARASAQIRVIADDSVVTASSDIKKVPPYKDFNVNIEPTAAGVSRVELCVAGLGAMTARIKISVESHLPQGEHTPIQPPRQGIGSQDGAWKYYRIVKQLRPEDTALLANVLMKYYPAGKRDDPAVVQEMAQMLCACECYDKCADLFESLPDQILSSLSEEVQEEMMLAYCRARSRFPVRDALADLDYTNPKRWSRFQKMVSEQTPRNAASIITSMVIEYRKLFVDEHNLGELLVKPYVMSGFTSVSEVLRTGNWLQDNGMSATCFKFVLNRLNEEIDWNEIPLLELCVEAGNQCGGRGLESVVIALAQRYYQSNEPEKALDMVNQHTRFLSDDDRAFLMSEIAGSLSDAYLSFWTYCEAAELYRKSQDVQSAMESIYRAKSLCQSWDDEQYSDAIERELAEIAEVETLFGKVEEIDDLTNKVRIFCRDRRVVVLGGDVKPSLVDWLKDNLNCTVDWHACSRETHVDRAGALLESVRKGRTCLVLQLRWSGHSDKLLIENECNSKEVPIIFCRSTNWKYVIRRTAQKLPIANPTK